MISAARQRALDVLHSRNPMETEIFALYHVTQLAKSSELSRAWHPYEGWCLPRTSRR